MNDRLQRQHIPFGAIGSAMSYFGTSTNLRFAQLSRFLATIGAVVGSLTIKLDTGAIYCPKHIAEEEGLRSRRTHCY